MSARFILASCALAIATIPSIAETQFPPGSGIGLDPPPGMSIAADFLGFQRGPASILIVELPPVAYAQINAKRERVAAKVEDPRFEDATVNGVPGFIVRGRQKAGPRVYRKWAVVLGAPSETALVTAQVPVDDTDVSDADIERALKTIVVRKPPSVAERTAALPFKVEDPAGFRQLDDTPTGATLGFTEGPKDVDPDGVQPHVVVGTSLDNPPPATNRGVFAEKVLKSLTALKSVEVKSTELFDAAGAQWAHVKASAHRGRRDALVDVEFYLRFGEGDFIAIVGTAPPGSAYGDRFRRLALSVQPNR